MIASVEPVRVSGLFMVAVWSTPAPLPTKSPVSDEDPVPPLDTASALERFSRLIVDEPVTAKVPDEVALLKVAPPLKAICVEVAFEGNGYAKIVAEVK